MRYTLGIDIGGTKISGVVFDGKKIVKQLTIVTPKSLPEFERNLLKLVDFLSAKQKISAIGIGMAGVMDAHKKIARHSPNIKYIRNLDFTGLFGRSKRLALGNDAKCFALAEAVLGQGKGRRNVVGLILGTGIGSGLVADGKIFYGSHYGAGEAGHMANERGQTLEQMFQRARDGRNNKALADICGAVFNNLYRAYDPDVLIVGGGVALDKKRGFINPAIKICARLLSSYRIKPVIKLSKLKSAGALGAALLVV